jgi:hypothetical protein
MRRVRAPSRSGEELEGVARGTTGVPPTRRHTSAHFRSMVSIPSALVLLVIALLGVMSSAGSASPAPSNGASPSGHVLRPSDASHDVAWGEAVRADAFRPMRPSVDKRDGSADRRDRSASANPAWDSLEYSATHASRSAGVVVHARAAAIRAPGLPAPSSRAPPIV